MRDSPPRSVPSPLDALTPALRGQLHRHCARMTGSFFDGEDVLQDALLKAHDAAGRMPRGIDNPQGWLFRIAHHAALDFLRRRRRDPVRAADDELLARASTADDEAERRWIVGAGLRRFLALTPTQRGAVILVDVLEHSLDDVAAITGRTLAATKSSLLRGRRRLRETLDAPAALPAESKAGDEDRSRVLAYAELFNARRFDALRDLLTEHVRVEVVGAATLQGKAAAAGRYFGNYEGQAASARPMRIDGRPALLMHEDGYAPYVVAVAFDGESIAAIRDFRHAGYELAASSVEPLGRSSAREGREAASTTKS